jgi:hypothetical protein
MWYPCALVVFLIRFLMSWQPHKPHKTILNTTIININKWYVQCSFKSLAPVIHDLISCTTRISIVLIEYTWEIWGNIRGSLFRIARDSWPYFTFSDSRLPQPEGPGSLFVSLRNCTVSQQLTQHSNHVTKDLSTVSSIMLINIQKQRIRCQ